MLTHNEGANTGIEHVSGFHNVNRPFATWPNGSLNIDGMYYLLGDNANASEDSRRFGGIPQEQIQGKVKLVLLGINAQHQLVENSYLKPVQ